MKSLSAALLVLVAPFASHAAVSGWLSWRGPQESGLSTTTSLPAKIDAQSILWSADFPGASTPVIANGKLYVMGYLGEGPELREGVACFDANTGKKLWEKLFGDFLSDTIYLRYATSSPEIDAETGNVYIQCTQGIFACFTADGKMLWQHSMMEEFGRLTFPNGRTATPAIDKDLVITRGITANWGKDGPAGDRFYGFDKKTGELVWASSPGDRPKDNSYSHPIFGWYQGKRVFYSALGDGSVACVNARTGEPIWRVSLYKAGINATVLLHNNDEIVAIYGTPYEPGQMVALKVPATLPAATNDGPVVLQRSALELWSNELRTSSSSPILAGDRIFVVSEVGDLYAVDVKTGKITGKRKIGIEQRNSCPLFAGGRLYVPILNDPEAGQTASEEGTGKGAFYVIDANSADLPILSKVVLEGRCFGSPAPYEGRVYQQTTRKLYCFGPKGIAIDEFTKEVHETWPAAGPATQLQVIPAEVLLRPGQKASFRVRELDANGLTVRDVTDIKSVHWAGYIPPTAKVRSSMKGAFDDAGQLVAAADPTPSAGAYEASVGNLKGYFRGRVLPGLPIKQDFESFQLTETNSDNALFSYPPLPWIGARAKFEVQEKDGNKSLTKTIDNPFLRRAFVFMGSPDLQNYTMEADIMSDGNRRKMSDGGVINQRYLVVLKGNEQKLEINSNQELLREAVAFAWTPNVWYHLKSRVDVAADGSGFVRAKAWKKGDAEPEKWTLEVPVKQAHTNGCPGLFGFSPQDMRVSIDNIAATQN